MFKITPVQTLNPNALFNLSLPEGNGKEVIVEAYVQEGEMIACCTVVNVQQFLRFMQIEQHWPEIRAAIHATQGYPKPIYFKGQRFEGAPTLVCTVVQWVHQMMNAKDRGIAGVRLMVFTQMLYQAETQAAANNLFTHLRKGEQEIYDSLLLADLPDGSQRWEGAADVNIDQYLNQRKVTDVYLMTE